jgi:hypothetical protein
MIHGVEAAAPIAMGQTDLGVHLIFDANRWSSSAR